MVVFWLLSLIWGLALKARIAVSEAHNVQRQYKALEERRASLEANLSAIKTERGQDSAIRTTFGVARPGEEVIVVVPPTPATTTSSLSWWQKVFNWFK